MTAETAPGEPDLQPVRQLGRLVLALAAVWVLMHLVAAGGWIGSHVLRSLHLGGAILLTLAARPLAGALRAIDAVIAVATVAAIGYLVVNSDDILMANWFSRLWLERILGVALFVALTECIRRALGLGFVLMIAVFIAYALFGNLVPGTLGHRGLTVDRLIFSFFLGTQGVMGMLIGISAGVVALFLIFGEFLNAGGAGRTFIDIALRLGGRVRGGAGLVAVIGSAFMGMINGSAVANVASTGVLTIPLMRRLGFSRNLSGSIEAVASTGGQFMPPIMGPGAFLMAELLGIAYLDVAVAALIPSTLFYIGLMVAVRLLASKENLEPIPDALIPPRRVAYAPMALIGLLVPIGLLVGMVIARYTVQYAVLWALGATVLLMAVRAVVDRALASGRGRMGGLDAADADATRAAPDGAANTGASAATPLPAAPPPLTRGDGPSPGFARTALTAIELSARNIAYVAMIIGAAQLIVAVINLTGLGATLSQIIVSLGKENLILSLILAMGVAILLGMGMPTPAAYAVAAAVLAPPLSRLGLDTLPSHLFIYYFACLAAITPPVASAIFAACAISGGKVIPTAGHALRLSLALYLIPFLFVSDPVLLMQGGATRVVLAAVTGGLGVCLLTVATVGHLGRPVHPVARGLAGLAAFALLAPTWMTDAGGLLLGAAVVGWHLRGTVPAPAPAADDPVRPR